MTMNQIQMTLEQIQFIMGQNPIIKTMIYTLIQYPMILNQMSNIINVLNYNPLIYNQLKIQMNQEMMMNMNLRNMMNNWTMINQQMQENNFKDKDEVLKDNSQISIIFRKNEASEASKPPIIIQCSRKDKVSDVIQKYRNESQDFDDTKRFVYNGKVLNPSLTLEEANMCDRATVFVVVAKGVRGG